MKLHYGSWLAVATIALLGIFLAWEGCQIEPALSLCPQCGGKQVRHSRVIATNPASPLLYCCPDCGAKWHKGANP
jgi:uncharacterized protein with PIN domain